jgi:hypothetical protein
MISLRELEQNAAYLAAAQAAWPELRQRELAAGQRLLQAMIALDVEAGILAMVDAEDARAAYLAYYVCSILKIADPDAHLGAVGE